VTESRKIGSKGNVLQNEYHCFKKTAEERNFVKLQMYAVVPLFNQKPGFVNVTLTAKKYIVFIILIVVLICGNLF